MGAPLLDETFAGNACRHDSTAGEEASADDKVVGSLEVKEERFAGFQDTERSLPAGLPDVDLVNSSRSSEAITLRGFPRHHGKPESFEGRLQQLLAEIVLRFPTEVG